MSALHCFALSLDPLLIVLTTVMAVESIVIFGLLFRANNAVKRGEPDSGAVLVFPIYFWYMLAISAAVFFRSIVLHFLAKDTKLWQFLQFVVAGSCVSCHLCVTWFFLRHTRTHSYHRYLGCVFSRRREFVIGVQRCRQGLFVCLFVFLWFFFLIVQTNKQTTKHLIA